MIQDLITTMENVGVSINSDDVDEILKIGIDAFLSRKGIDLLPKHLDSVYIILHEMKSK